jgi:hypothetical protein
MESKTESKLSWLSSLRLRLRELKQYIQRIFKVEIVDSKEDIDYAKYSSCFKD